MNSFLDFLRANLPHLPTETLELIQKSFVPLQKQKGDILLRQGMVSQDLYFLAEGIARSYSTRDGQDITTWFGFKNEFITSFTSFFPQKPSYETIEMLSDGTLYQISWHQLDRIRKRSLTVERIINHFSLLYTIQLEKRLFVIQTYTAAEKYKLILDQEPHLIQSISNTHLASYLGITRETLSRIRARII